MFPFDDIIMNPADNSTASALMRDAEDNFEDISLTVPAVFLQL